MPQTNDGCWAGKIQHENWGLACEMKKPSKNNA
jgi:hypothetical protein